MINYKGNPENKEAMSLISLILIKNLKDEELSLKEEFDKLEESKKRGKMKGINLTFRLSDRLSNGDNSEEVIKQFESALNLSNRTLLELEMKYDESKDKQLRYEIAYQEALSSTLETLKESINSSLR